MMEKFGNREGQEGAKELAGKWKTDYRKSLTEIFQKEGSDMEDFVSVVWQGILNRINPTDKEIIEARKKLNKFVLELDRNDPEVYWRILYGVISSKDAAVRGFTKAPDELTTGIINMALIFLAENNGTVKYFSDPENAQTVLMDKIIEKSQEELKKRGVIPHALPVGAVGKYKGIEVEIDGYYNGLISLKASTEEGHMQLGKLNKYSTTVSPSELNPKEFNL